MSSSFGLGAGPNSLVWFALLSFAIVRVEGECKGAVLVRRLGRYFNDVSSVREGGRRQYRDAACRALQPLSMPNMPTRFRLIRQRGLATMRRFSLAQSFGATALGIALYSDTSATA